MTKARTHLRSAFTLIELLVVISIILIVVSLTIPAVNAAKRQAHNEAAYGATGYQFGLLRDRSGNLIGTAPSAASGWHGYTTDDIMNFTFAP